MFARLNPRRATPPEAAAPDRAVTVDGLAFAYDTQPVLRGVSFAIGAGEIVCLVGPSGCGKTTTLRLVAGLEPMQGGSIAIGGREVAGPSGQVPTERRNVGLMFQDYALFPHLTVIQNVTFGLSGRPAAARRARALSVLGEVGLASHAEAWPHQLSGGQQQRVALARALAPSPRVMLLDEPFSGLDRQLRDQVRDDAMHLLKASGAATLMVTHDPEEAMFMADRIAVMRDGRIEQMGTPEDIYCRPASAFVAGFFGDVNRLAGTVAGAMVVTPLCNLPNPGFADGHPVQVLIRPEALRLSPTADAGALRVTVQAARMLGRSSLVHLALGAGPRALHLHARVPGRFLPREGDTFAVMPDAEQAFVFPDGPV